MGDLVAWYLQASANKELHPIEVAAEFHYKFVCIHPFDDGNGRISRLLMNYHLIKNGYPPVIIKSTDKKNYLFALHEADTGNIEAFKNYVAEQLVWSYEISIKAAKGESVDEVGDWEKKVTLLKKKTVSNQNINPKKSKDILALVIELSFIPLIKSIYTKLSPLYELYADATFYLSINAKREETYNNFDVFLNPQIYLKDDLYTIFYVHRLNSFLKNGSDFFHSSYQFTFTFLDDNYSIQYTSDSDIMLVKNYGSFLTKNEIENIETSIANMIYNQIDSYLSKKK